MDFNDKGVIECPECKGNRIVPSKEYPGLIHEVCSTCKGHGNMDWIDYAMGRRINFNRDLQYKISYQNINKLMYLIQQEGMKMNKIIRVDIQEHYMDDPYKSISNFKF
jgi:hypothetical protein